MRISFKTTGEAEMLRRLTELAELPGLDLALDNAARVAAEAARTELQDAGDADIADTVRVTRDANGHRLIAADHSRAWFAEHGTLRRPALRWLASAGQTGIDHLRVTLISVLSRSVRKAAGRGGEDG